MKLIDGLAVTGRNDRWPVGLRVGREELPEQIWRAGRRMIEPRGAVPFSM